VAKVEKATEKSLCGSSYSNGQGDHFRSANGMRLGAVRRNDPDPEWRFTDRAAFEAHVRALHPGVVETRTERVPHKDDEVLAVLCEHAPHLVRDVDYVPDEVFTDALAHSRDTGEPAGPGIEWVAPIGSLVVTPDKAAVTFLRDAMRTQLDTLYPKALPAAEEDRRAS